MDYRIIVPLDGSSQATSAVPWADSFAHALAAEVELLYVVSQPRGPGASPHSVYDDYGDGDVAFGQRALGEGLTLLSDTTPAHTDVRYGTVAEAIVARAQRWEANLIVMATRGHSGPPGSLVGSVTARVIRHSHVPVLTVRPGATLVPETPKRVLIPLDGSDLSRGVLPYVLPIARALHAEIQLYWVKDGQSNSDALEGIKATEAELEAQGFRVHLTVGSGERGESIVAFATRNKCGLIAMSTHGREGVGRWTFGSVTEWVIRHSDMPVLAVRPSLMPSSTTVAAETMAAQPQTAERLASVVLTEAQLRVVRLALEHLGWSASRHEHLSQDIRGALGAVDAAKEDLVTRAPVLR